MSVPVIGVTSYLEVATTGVWTLPATYLPSAYHRPIELLGAAVVVLPPQAVRGDTADRVIAGLDGLYVAGGYDVSPALYGATPHRETDAPRVDRDAWELALIDAALEQDLPLLGVCRGAQLLNVAYGGTLHQHVPDVVGHPGYQAGHGVFVLRDVEVAAGTTLAGLHPARRAVPVYHHQAIDAVGEGLAVSARSVDGLVEAVEDPGREFCVAVQWHPEKEADPLATDLFAGFVRAAATRAASR